MYLVPLSLAEAVYTASAVLIEAEHEAIYLWKHAHACHINPKP